MPDNQSPLVVPSTGSTTAAPAASDIGNDPIPLTGGVAPKPAAPAAEPLGYKPIDPTADNTPDIVKKSAFHEAVVSELRALPENQAVDQAVRLSQGDIRWPLEYFKGVSPDVVAHIQNLAKNNGVGYDVANASKEELDKIQQAKDVYDMLSANNADGTPSFPNTIKWLKDPMNMGKSHDDVAALKELEQHARARYQMNEGYWTTIVRGMAADLLPQISGVLSTPAAYMDFNSILADRNVNMMTNPWDARRDPLAPISAIKPDWEGIHQLHQLVPNEADRTLPAPETPQWLRDFGGLVPMLNQQGENMYPEKLRGRTFAGDIGSFDPAAAFQTGMVGSTSTIALLAATLLTKSPNLMLTVGSASSGGMQYQQDLAMGKSGKAASVDFLLNAAAEFYFEKKFGTISMMDKLEEAAGKKVLSESTAGMIGRLAKLALITSAKGGLSEGATQIAQDTADFATGNKDAYKDEAAKVLNATLLGFVSDFGFTAPASILNGYAQVRNQQLGQQAWDSFTKTAENSKLRQRDPEAFAQFVNGTMEAEGKPTTFGVDADKVAVFFQNDINQVNEFAASIGITPEQMADAVKTGSEIQVDIGKFSAKYAGTDIDVALNKDFRFVPGGLSTNELEAEIARVTEQATVLRDTVTRLATSKEELPQQIAVIRDVMLKPKEEGGAGYSAETADSMLSVLIAGVANLAKQRNETTAEAFKRLNLTLEVVPGKKPSMGSTRQNADASFVKGEIVLDKGKNTIRLFEKADYSTFIHETGHLFLNEIKTLIDQGMASEQTIADFEAMKKFVGGEFENTDEGIAREEKLIRAFEAYLREGKAPSVALVNAFNRFRQWLMAIYRSVAVLGNPINDELRQTFDRMLAADEDIKDAQEYYSRRSEIVDLIQADDKTKAALKDKQDKAASSALDKQVEILLRAYFKAVGSRDAIQKAAAEQVDNLPVYKAIEYLRGNKLSADKLADAIGKKAAEEFRKKYPSLVSDKSRLSPSELAAQFDFQSPESMLDVMQAALPKNEAVKQYTKNLIAEKEGQLRGEVIRRGATPADEAMHTEASLAYLIAETQLMADHAARASKTSVRIDEKVYRDAAKVALRGMPVERAIRVDLFAKTEARLAKAVIAQARKGNWDNTDPKKLGALQLREKQLAQHALAQEAIKASKLKEKIEDHYSDSKINSLLKNVEHSYINPILQLLSTYKMTDKTPDEVVDLKEKFTDLDPALVVLTPEWIMNGEKAGNYRKLLLSELIELDDTVKTLFAYGKDQMLSLKGEDARRFSEFEAAAIKRMSALKSISVPQGSGVISGPSIVTENEDGSLAVEKGKKEWMKNPNKVWEYLKSNTMMMSFLTGQADNFSMEREGFEAEHQRLYRMMKEAELAKRDQVAKIAEASNPHWVTLRKAGERLEKQLGFEFVIEGLSLPEKLRPEGRQVWSAHKLIAALLNMGNAHNFEVLTKSYNFDQSQVDRISKFFTKEELQAIQGIWDVTNTMFPALDKSHFEVYNRHLEKVESRPITLTAKDGSITLPGGYYPLIFDHALNKNVAERNENELMNQTLSVMQATKPKDGMTFSRTAGHSLPPLLSLSVWAKHVDDTARYTHLTAPVRDWNVLTKSDNWSTVFISKFGKDYYVALRKWLSYQALPAKRPVGEFEKPVDKAADWMRARAVYAYLGFKFTNGLAQRTAIINAASILGWEWIGKGYSVLGVKNVGTSVLGLSNTDAWKGITEMSDYIRQREMNAGNQDIREQVDRIQLGAKTFNVAGREFTVEDVRNFAFTWLTMNDRAIIAPIWSGAFHKYMETMRDPAMTQEEATKQAVIFADRIIERTQPSSLNVELSNAQMSEGWYRFFVAFASWGFKFGNILHYNIRGVQEGAISNGQAINWFVHNIMAEPWFRLVMYSVIGGSAPDWYEWLLAPLSTFFQWIPTFGSHIRSLSNKGRFASLDELVPAAEGFKRAGRLVKDAMAGDGWQVAWDLGRLTEFYFNVPALNVVKSLKDAYATAAGDDDLKKRFK